MIVWSPVVSRATAITATWPAAPGPYTLQWGDGTSTTRRPGQAPAVHNYPGPGTWDLVAVPHNQPGHAVAARATTRAWSVIPRIEVDYTTTGQGLVLTLPDVPLPRAWEVDWGDGTTTVHAADDTPTHTYPWGFGAPELRVTDLPSRRNVRFTGPPIGEQPAPPESQFDGCHFEYLKRLPGARRFFFHGGGIRPGSTVTLTRGARTWTHEFTANDKGEVHEYLDLDTETDGSWWATFEQWDTYCAEYTTINGDHRADYLPLHAPDAEKDTRSLPYLPHPDQTRTVEFIPFPAQLGEHRIQFGDGYSETVNATKLPLRVRHTYDGNGPYTARCTFPDGTTASIPVRTARPVPCPPRPIGRDTIQLLWAEGTWCGDANGELYPPLCVRLNNGTPVYYHKPNSGSSEKIGYGFYGLGAGEHTLTLSSTFTEPWTETVTLEGGSTRGGDVFVEVVVPDDWQPDPERRPAPEGTWSHSFHVGDISQPDHYTCYWDITNTSTTPYTPAVEFTLADPARVADVSGWRGDVNLVELGSGRWRLENARPIDGGDEVRIEIRVEPCGDPRVWPAEVVVT